MRGHVLSLLLFFLMTKVSSSSSTLAPDLQPAGKENGGAIRGTLGDCNEDLAIYRAFVPRGASYYCNLADTAYTTFKSKYYPNTDLCDWGFGELIPRPTTNPITGDKDYGPPIEKEWALTPGTTPGSTAAETMFEKYACAAPSSVALAGGSSPGRLYLQQMCSGGISQACDLARNSTLTYPTSMGVYNISTDLHSFIQTWRGLYHKPNINFGNVEKYYAGWTRKLVRCEDVPKWLLSLGHIASGMTVDQNQTESEMEMALQSWLKLDSLLNESMLNASFTGPPDDYNTSDVTQPELPKVTIRMLSNQTDKLPALLEISIWGPADRWFGIGFGATSMADATDTLLVTSDGDVSETTLKQYGLGASISPMSFKGKSRHVYVNNTRGLTFLRNATQSIAGRYNFTISKHASIPYIWASGMDSDSISSHVVSGASTTKLLG